LALAIGNFLRHIDITGNRNRRKVLVLELSQLAPHTVLATAQSNDRPFRPREGRQDMVDTA
jgi:hypothetical protein